MIESFIVMSIGTIGCAVIDRFMKESHAKDIAKTIGIGVTGMAFIVTVVKCFKFFRQT